MSKRFLRRKEVERLTGLSRSAIYAQLSANTFPKPYKLSPRSVGWLETDIDRWIEERVAAGPQSDQRGV